MAVFEILCQLLMAIADVLTGSKVISSKYTEYKWSLQEYRKPGRKDGVGGG